MPAKPSFSGAERTAPENLKEPENPYVREKIFILLLMNDGKTYQEISEFLDIAYPTVADWAVQGDPDNLESFWMEEEKVISEKLQKSRRNCY
jgi:transposase